MNRPSRGVSKISALARSRGMALRWHAENGEQLSLRK
jgi:hypothetical protein